MAAKKTHYLAAVLYYLALAVLVQFTYGLWSMWTYGWVVFFATAVVPATGGLQRLNKTCIAGLLGALALFVLAIPVGVALTYIVRARRQYLGLILGLFVLATALPVGSLLGMALYRWRKAKDASIASGDSTPLRAYWKRVGVEFGIIITALGVIAASKAIRVARMHARFAADRRYAQAIRNGDLDALKTEFRGRSPETGASVVMLHDGWNGLYNAAHAGQREVVDYFVSRGSEVDLFVAAMLGDLELLEEVHAKRPEAIDATGPGRRTALMWATQLAHADVAARLLELGADANIETAGCGRAIDIALEKKSDALLAVLAPHSDMRTGAGYRMTPLCQAVARGSGEAVAALLKAGALPDAPGGSTGECAVHVAARMGHKDIVEMLLARGPDVNAMDTRGKTPLHVATSAKHTEVVKVLLESGADVNMADNQGHTALRRAVTAGARDIAVLLLDRGADVTAVDARNRTVMDVARSKGRTEIVKSMYERGLGIEYRNRLGRTPIHIEARHGDEEMLAILCTRGADVDAVSTHDGEAALHLLARAGEVRKATILLKAGATVDLLDTKGATPLVRAVYRNQVEMVKLLIAHGADISRKGRYDWTPLHGAAYSDSAEVVILLLRHGADTKAKTDNGRTPRDVAKERAAIAFDAVLRELREGDGGE